MSNHHIHEADDIPSSLLPLDVDADAKAIFNDVICDHFCIEYGYDGTWIFKVEYWSSTLTDREFNDVFDMIESILGGTHTSMYRAIGKSGKRTIRIQY